MYYTLSFLTGCVILFAVHTYLVTNRKPAWYNHIFAVSAFVLLAANCIFLYSQMTISQYEDIKGKYTASLTDRSAEEITDTADKVSKYNQRLRELKKLNHSIIGIFIPDDIEKLDEIK